MPNMIYELVDGHPMPRLPFIDGHRLEPDGFRYFTVEQAADKFKIPAKRLRENWLATWSGIFPETAEPAEPQHLHPIGGKAMPETAEIPLPLRQASKGLGVDYRAVLALIDAGKLRAFVWGKLPRAGARPRLRVLPGELRAAVLASRVYVPPPLKGPAVSPKRRQAATRRRLAGSDLHPSALRILQQRSAEKIQKNISR